MAVILGALALLVLAACAAPAPETVEVTRLVETAATVEVTRVVEVAVESAPLEVTRVVEVVVTPTEAPAPTAEVPPTAEPSPTPEPTATSAAGQLYTVQPGESLALIAERAGTTVAALQAANGMGPGSVLLVGQELLIPGPDTVLPTAVAAEVVPEAPAEELVAEAAPETAVVAAAPAGGNLLPNPSFEEGWHFFLYNELQVPDGWQLATDEGPNNLEQGAGGLFNRPEVRVVPSKDLPPAEHSTFILSGDKTVKAFKGGAPTSFSMFTDVALPAGSYRLQVRFVPDTVAGYEDFVKVYASDPLAGEARAFAGNGGTGWQGTAAGQANTLTYDFTLDTEQTVRVGGGFRNRYIMANNGWFLDDWSLTRLE